MSETRTLGDMTVTRYGGPVWDAVKWKGKPSRVRYEIWRGRDKLADLSVRDAACLAKLLRNL